MRECYVLGPTVFKICNDLRMIFFFFLFTLNIGISMVDKTAKVQGR